MLKDGNETAVTIEDIDPLKLDSFSLLRYLKHNGYSGLSDEEITPNVLMVVKGLLNQLKVAYEMGGVDSLTGLENRLEFEAKLEREVEKRKFKGTVVFGDTVREDGRRASAPGPATLVSIDLNYLKQINQVSGLGHNAGDAVLKEFAEFLSKNLRKDDVVARPLQKKNGVVARVGGDEFWLILYDTTPEKAKQRLEKLREEFRKEKFYFDPNPEVEEKIEIFDRIRENIREGKSNIRPEDRGYIPPGEADRIIPSFAFGCALIDEKICREYRISTAVAMFKDKADKEMDDDKAAWKARQAGKAAPADDRQQIVAETPPAADHESPSAVAMLQAEKPPKPKRGDLDITLM